MHKRPFPTSGLRALELCFGSLKCFSFSCPAVLSLLLALSEAREGSSPRAWLRTWPIWLAPRWGARTWPLLRPAWRHSFPFVPSASPSLARHFPRSSCVVADRAKNKLDRAAKVDDRISRTKTFPEHHQDGRQMTRWTPRSRSIKKTKRMFKCPGQFLTFSLNSYLSSQITTGSL